MPAPTHTATFDSVFVTSTDTDSTPADKIAGVRDLTKDESTAMTETTYLGDKVATSLPGVKTISFSLSGDVMNGDAPQQVLRDAYENGTMCYLTVITDPNATVGQEKGKRYGCYLESYSEKRPQGNVIGFDAKFVLGSTTITAVLAA